MEKTCGNCGHGCYESTVYCQVTNDDMLVSCEACDDWVDPSEHHIKRDAIASIEQRYKQLEQIAKDMFKEIEYCQDEGSWWLEGNDFEKQLKQLGVVIDE